MNTFGSHDDDEHFTSDDHSITSYCSTEEENVIAAAAYDDVYYDADDVIDSPEILWLLAGGTINEDGKFILSPSMKNSTKIKLYIKRSSR